MPTPEVWGPATWTLFHVLAEKVNERMYPRIAGQLFDVIKRICSALPCPDCAQDATIFLNKVKLHELRSKKDFKNMVYMFHNYVNAKKRKPLYNVSNLEIYKKYNIVFVFNRFISVYHTKGNMRLLAESFQRQLIIRNVREWFSRNVCFFVPCQQQTPAVVEEPVPVVEPIIEAPIIEEPLVEEPIIEEPLVEEPIIEAPIIEAPIIEAPIIEEPIVEQPVVEEPIIEEPIVEEPIIEQPVVEEPIIEEPIIEAPIIKEPVVEEPIIEQPVVEESIVEEPIVEESIVEEPIIKEPVVEEPIIEEPVVEEPIIEEAVVGMSSEEIEVDVEEPIVSEAKVEEEPILSEEEPANVSESKEKTKSKRGRKKKVV